jgi:hypothetical protein
MDAEGVNECSICYDNESNSPFIDLSCCMQTVHKECVCKLRSPDCPFCRAPLVDLSQDELANVKRRKVLDAEERETAEFRALLQHEAGDNPYRVNYLPGTPGFVDALLHLFKFYSIPSIISFQSQPEFVDVAHAHMHEHEDDAWCFMVDLFLAMVYQFFACQQERTRHLETSHDISREIIQWCLANIQTIPFVVMPQVAFGTVFPNTDITLIQSCVVEALCIFSASALLDSIVVVA